MKIKDLGSGLVWQACLAGQSYQEHRCIGTPLDLTWNEADGIARSHAERDLTDWRLPTLEELETIVDASCRDFAIPAVFAIGKGVEIWTASPGFPVNDVAAIVNLETGQVFGVGKSVTRHFWLVSGELAID